MKKHLLLLSSFIPMMVFSQTTIIDENFDSYTAGNYIGNESSNFNTWSNAPGTAEDALITDTISSSPSNSVHIAGNAGPTDVILAFPNTYTSGKYEFSMKFLVSVGKGGYFNIQESTTAGVAWKLDLFFSSLGGVEILGGSTPGTATYTPGAWTDIKVIIDLDTDKGDVYINNNLEHTYTFSTGTDGAGSSAAFGGINFFAYGGTSSAIEDAEYYFDDVMLVDVTGVGVEETKAMELALFPNPSNGSFSAIFNNIETDYYDVQLIDVSGKVVFNNNTFITDQSTFDYQFDLPAGIYTLSVNNNNKSILKRIIIQ